MANQDLLTCTLVELADTLVDDFDIVDLLTLLADRCCETFDVDDAGLMMAAPVGGDLRVMASSSSKMRNLEHYELQAREGPCLDCYRTGEPVINEDLGMARERWPGFSTLALAGGFRTVTSLPMRLRGMTIGALNLFLTGDKTMSDSDLSGARAYADVATISILQHQAARDASQVNEHLNRALNSRVIIEQAKGMLAERAGIDVDEAFVRLRHHARHHHLRLGDLAQEFIAGKVTPESLEPSHPAPQA